MTATVQAKPWDFSHVLELVNSLSTQPSDTPLAANKDSTETNGLDIRRECVSPLRSECYENIIRPSSALGDFSKIWQALGAKADAAAPAVQKPLTPNKAAEKEDTVPNDVFLDKVFMPNTTDYTSDGAVYIKPPASHAKTVQWQDTDGYEEQTVDTGAGSDSSTIPQTPTLTKSQRKKRNRRARREREAAFAVEQEEERTTVKSAKPMNGVVSESEADTFAKKAPAKKAGSHIIAAAVREYNLRQRDASGKAITAITPESVPRSANDAAEKIANPSKKLDSSHSADRKQVDTPSNKADEGSANHGALTPTWNPKSLTNGATAVSLQDGAAKSSLAKAAQFTPSSVLPAPRSVPIATSAPQQSLQNQNAMPQHPPNSIQPIIVRSGEDRNWALLMKLIGDFYQDRAHLINPMNLTTHNNHPKGIHVFVDASNIFIGFLEQLKRSRGIPPWTHVPAVDLSFDALALLLERRRPVAKRVLAGSNPRIPAIDKAEAVGYECNLMDKVLKARLLTERQIYFKERDRHGGSSGGSKRAKVPPSNAVLTATNVAHGRRPNGYTSGENGSGSETNTPQYAPLRMVEQGVDEVLHLKILESIVDVDEPGTMVLATGDAAQAEYSDGFMVMAERALKKGWTVELVSWSKNISSMYTRSAWINTWGERFRIVYLDDYAEELLDM